jgi:hypothetical protein
VSRRILLGVALIYLAAASVVLFQAHGLPYGVDGNESFSNTIHAGNMATFSWTKSFGLTDESYGVTASAHPYVHSHQGNFPRFFVFGLRLLGLRSVESQIVATTLTIGLATIVLAFLYFAEAVNPVFGGICCLVLISDYLLFGQWQVNSYRVWHGFFFFSSLRCTLSLIRRPRRSAALLTLVNFACLCYWEYVFASFVLTMVALYAFALSWRRPLRVALVWGLIGLAGLTAAAVLGTQLTGYMGWRNTLKDVSYTLHARNSAEDSVFAAKVSSFYAEHKVVFWPNYVDASRLRNPAAFFNSLLGHHLQYYSPWLAFLMVFTLVAWILVATVPGAPKDEVTRHSAWARTGWCRIALGLGASVLAVSWLMHQRRWFDWTQAPIWEAAGGLQGWIWPVALIGTGIILLQMIVRPSARMVGSDRTWEVDGILPFLAAGLGAYLMAYRIFTGYVYSGYLDRQAPFLVFLTDPLLALVFYTLISHIGARLKRPDQPNPSEPAWPGPLVAAACLGLVGILAVGWIRLQREYLRIMPPDRFGFMKNLERAPYRNSSFVVNTYAAPTAAQTRSWAYFEPAFFYSSLRLNLHGFSIERDRTYKWLADFDDNPGYAKPDYALIISPMGWKEALAAYLQPPARTQAVDHSAGLLGRASAEFSAYLHDQVVAAEAGSGGANFTIIKLDWDYPAYLLPLPIDLSAFAAQTVAAQANLTLVEVRTLPRKREKGSDRIVAIESELGDSEPAALALRDQGWTTQSLTGSKGAAVITVETGTPAWLQTVVAGNDVRVGFATGPQAGKLALAVNDFSGDVDLQTSDPGEKSWHFDAATTRPAAIPGQYVSLHHHKGNLEISYRFAHQEGKPEENTQINLLNRDVQGRWRIVQTLAFLGREGWPVDLIRFRRENPDTLHEYGRIQSSGDARSYEAWLADYLAEHPTERHRIGLLGPSEATVGGALPGQTPIRHLDLRLPPNLSGPLVALVRPGTRTKLGPVYFSNYLDDDAADQVKGASVRANVLYGQIDLRVRLPVDRMGRSEPLVTTGVTGAGDFVYVVYHDLKHIRIGFDHWGVRGVISPPIPIDYARVHRLSIRLGSLFPPDGDVLFRTMATGQVDALKNEVRVILDDAPVLEFLSPCYESPPAFVSIGQNTIGGSTTDSSFSGKILEVARPFKDGSTAPSGQSPPRSPVKPSLLDSEH